MTQHHSRLSEPHAPVHSLSSRSLSGKAGSCYFCGARFILRRRFECCHVGCTRSFCDSCGIVLDGKARAVCSHHAKEYLSRRALQQQVACADVLVWIVMRKGGGVQTSLSGCHFA